MAVDWIREGAPYRVRMRLFADSDRVDWVTWYEVPRGTPFLPIPSVYRNATWDSDTAGPPCRLGEQRPGVFFRPALPRPGPGRCYVGPADWWLHGMPVAALSRPIPARMACCDTPDIDGAADGLTLADGYARSPYVLAAQARGVGLPDAAFLGPVGVTRLAEARGAQRGDFARLAPVGVVRLAEGWNVGRGSVIPVQDYLRAAVALSEQLGDATRYLVPPPYVRSADATDQQQAEGYGDQPYRLRADASDRQQGEGYGVQPYRLGADATGQERGEGYGDQPYRLRADASDTEQGDATRTTSEDDVPALFDGPNQTDVTFPPGAPLAGYLTGTGYVLASAAGLGVECLGLATVGALPGHTETCLVGGLLTLPDWTAVTGSPSLPARSRWFVSADTPGLLTQVRPTARGQVVQYVGVAIGPQTMSVEIGTPYLL